MAPKKRKTDASAPAAKKPRRKRSKPEKPRGAKEADLADITPLAKEALAEIGDGDKNAASVATKINEILGRQEKKQFDQTSLTSLLAPSRHGKALGIGKKEVDPYRYADKSNPQLLSASASDIAIVEESGADVVLIQEKLQACGDGEDEADGGCSSHRGERFVVVTTVSLGVAAGC